MSDRGLVHPGHGCHTVQIQGSWSCKPDKLLRLGDKGLADDFSMLAFSIEPIISMDNDISINSDPK